MFGVEQFVPVINIPEACIMGVGSIVSQPVLVDGEVTVRDRMHLTLACDHRVTNGAEAAQFLQTLRRLLESPMLAVL
jgi:pyruvate dehydrogenase E2 component (dihydrolipoamide acetyltransferase)